MKWLPLFLLAATTSIGCSKKSSAARPSEQDTPTVPARADTLIVQVKVDESELHQTIAGFGGFGARDVYWSNTSFTDTAFVNTIIDDLGLTILRDNIPTDFESINDNADAGVTDLSKFAGSSLDKRLQYLRDMRARGLTKLIVSIWSAPPWMKTNNRIDNGTTQNAAPEYDPSPTAANNQLRTDMYDEFAERCVAYLRYIHAQTGLDVYALSLQNEPRFSQSYESCVYNGEALRNLVKTVGKRFHDENITTKIFLPEDVGWFEGTDALIQPILQDAEAMSYVGMIATHGYALDGVSAASTDAQTWQRMSAWGAADQKPLWLTEVSGFPNTMNGAISLSKAMYTALSFGNIEAWVHWGLSESAISEQSLMSTAGEKSKRYYASKNVYRYVRPGSIRVGASVADTSGVYALAFMNAGEKSHTVVMINDNNDARKIVVSGAGLPADFEMFVTSKNDDCKSYGTVLTGANIAVPPGSIVTLYKQIK